MFNLETKNYAQPKLDKSQMMWYHTIKSYEEQMFFQINSKNHNINVYIFDTKLNSFCKLHFMKIKFAVLLNVRSLMVEIKVKFMYNLLH